MKGIILLGITLLTTGCACNTCYTTELVQYRQVRVAPVVPVVTRVVAPVIQPVIIDAGYIEPLDVTTTTIDFY